MGGGGIAVRIVETGWVGFGRVGWGAPIKKYIYIHFFFDKCEW